MIPDNSLATILGFLLFLFYSGMPSQENHASLPKCSEAKVQYTPFDESYSERIILRTVPNTGRAESQGNKEYSPQRTAWMSSISPDYSQPGPWNTTVTIGNETGSKVLQLRFEDHASGEVSVKWLNERLVFGRVWWGRIYSTDFIFDVEKEQFIYKQMAHYGEMIQPCRR